MYDWCWKNIFFCNFLHSLYNMEKARINVCSQSLFQLIIQISFSKPPHPHNFSPLQSMFHAYYAHWLGGFEHDSDVINPLMYFLFLAWHYSTTPQHRRPQVFCVYSLLLRSVFGACIFIVVVVVVVDRHRVGRVSRSSSSQSPRSWTKVSCSEEEWRFSPEGTASMKASLDSFWRREEGKNKVRRPFNKYKATRTNCDLKMKMVLLIPQVVIFRSKDPLCNAEFNEPILFFLL